MSSRQGWRTATTYCATGNLQSCCERIAMYAMALLCQCRHGSGGYLSIHN